MHTLVFVCHHGALKSRIAAAFFNRVAPLGWRAVSAGLEPQEEVSVHAPALLAGLDAASHLDLGPPQALSAMESPDRVVAIDCDLPGALSWHLSNTDPGAGMRDELCDLAERLAGER